ncbi:hypothetical protein LDFHOB_10030 [Candidatus Electronema aureum]
MNQVEQMSERKLGVVKDIVEAVGMSISHVYEDLIFLNHNAFLLQFTDENNTLLLHSNQEASKELLRETTAPIKAAAAENGMKFLDGGSYRLTQGSGESLQIEFFS